MGGKSYCVMVTYTNATAGATITPGFKPQCAYIINTGRTNSTWYYVAHCWRGKGAVLDYGSSSYKAATFTDSTVTIKIPSLSLFSTSDPFIVVVYG